MKQMKEDLTKWRYIPGSCVRRLNTVRALTLPDFKTFYKATVIKKAWY